MAFARRFIALLLSLTLAWQASEPQAWAAPAAPCASAFSALFNQQTLSGRFVAGYTGPTPSIFIRQSAPRAMTRRLFMGTAAALALSVFTGIGYSQERPSDGARAPETTASLPRSFHDLRRQFLAHSPQLREDFHAIRAAEINLQAQAARNVSVGLNQNDLTHSPRVPLGNSSATSAPLIPRIDDVIGRSIEQIDGPIRRWESLEQKQNTLFKSIIDKLETLALRGGYTRNSDAKVALSWQNYYLAAIDVEDAATKPFEHMDARWQALQAKWFDLAALDIEARRLMTVKAFKQKKMAEAQYRLAKGVVTDPLGKQIDLFHLQSDVDAAEGDLITLAGKQKMMAGDLVILYLRGTDADKTIAAGADAYRPLMPQVHPTLAMIERILLDTPQPLNHASAQAFRQAVKAALHLTDAEVPADPSDVQSRQLVLDRLWSIKNFNASIPQAGGVYDPAYAPSLSAADEYLARAQTDLLRRAPPTPQQATLFVKIKRSFELAQIFKLQELRQWSITIFMKLGLDLPIQTAMQSSQPIDNTRNELLIAREDELRKAVNALLDSTQDQTDADVKAARTALENARNDMRQAAHQAADWLSKVPTVVMIGDKEVTDWEDPAYELELRLAAIEQRALAQEKAYQQLHYLLVGRLELRREIDDQLKAYSAAETARPANLVPSTPARQRNDLALPVIKGVRGAALLLLSPLWAKAASNHSLVHYVVHAPTWADAILSAAFFIALFMMSHWMRHRFRKEKRVWIGAWAGLLGLAALAFPLGAGYGFAIGAGLAAWGWMWSPDKMTEHRPNSLADKATHLINRRTFFSEAAQRLVQLAIGLWLSFPIFNSLAAGWQAFYDFISNTGTAENATGFHRVRWPLSYTPPQSGNLVRVNPPAADGVLKQRYLVRWIGPNTDPSHITDAVFVFQTASETGAVEDEIIQARAAVQIAQAQVAVARSQSRHDALPSAEAALSDAQSRLTNAQSKSSLRDELLPTDRPIEIDRTLLPAQDRVEAIAGHPRVLAYQKSSRAAILGLTLAPAEYAALGTGMAQPDRWMRMRFTTPDDGDVVVPVAAIQKLQRAERETATNARERDVAKGGLQEIFRDAAILVTDAMVDEKRVHEWVPPKTLEFLKTLNSENPEDTLSSLHFDRFEEWKDGRWQTYSETLPANVVMADAELQATSAEAPHAGVPQQNAAIDVKMVTEQVAALETERAELQRQRAALDDSTSAALAADRNDLDQKIRTVDGEIAALRTHLGHQQSGVIVRENTGVVIPAQALSRVQGSIFVYARDRIARLLNPWSETQTNTAPAADAAPPEDVAAWDPHALEQVQSETAIIRVRTALETYADISKGPWDVEFPSESKPVVYRQAITLAVNDVVQDLSQAGVIRAFPLAGDARGPGVFNLIPIPGSLLPVKFHVTGAVSARAADAAPSTAQDDDTIRQGLQWLLRTATGGFLLSTVIVVYKIIQQHRLKTPRTVSAPGASNRPFDRKGLNTPRPFLLASYTSAQQKTLQKYFSTRYLEYGVRDAQGRRLKPHERFYKKFGATVVSRKDSKFFHGYWLFEQHEARPNQRIVHFLYTLAWSGFFGLLTWLARNSALQDLRTSIFPGNPTIDILRIRVLASIIDWHKFPQLLLHNPAVILNHVALTVYLMAFLAAVALAITWILGQLTPAGVRLTGAIWYRAKRAEARIKDFETLSKERNPDGSPANFEDEMAKVRDDDKARKDPRVLKVQDRDEFMNEFSGFSDMMTRRASHHLWGLAIDYLREKPEVLDAQRGSNPFATEARRVASDARLWATVLENVARSLTQPDALIPFDHPLDKLQDRPVYNDAEIRQIATDILGMDLDRIRGELARRMTDSTELQKHLDRIEQEYLDRAKVLWAIDEMEKRTIRAFVAIHALDALGWCMQPTGDKEADGSFDAGEVENTLREYDKWLPTFLPNAEKLRERSVRETPMFQGYRYLSGGFGVPDPDEKELGDVPQNGAQGKSRIMNPNLADAFPALLVNPDSKKLIIRLKGAHGQPTFEGMAIPFYTTGDWSPELVNKLIEFLVRQAGFTPEKTAAKVASMQDILRKYSTRRTVAWFIVRVLQKVAPENFKNILHHMRGSPNRKIYDVRYWSDPAPVMDDQGNTSTTNADLKIAAFKYRSLLEHAISVAGPILGNRDFFGDLSLEINPKRAAEDAGLDKRSIEGRVELLALSDPSDDFAGDLGQRIPTREPELGPEIRIRSSQQTAALLPTAGGRRADSIFEISPQPPHVANAINSQHTDPRLNIVIVPNLYLKYAARLLFFYKMIPAAEREAFLARMGPHRAAFEEELRNIESTLERMNIRVKIYTEWNDAILDHDVPTEDNDNSYNTIVFIAPSARPNLNPSQTARIDRSQMQLMHKEHMTPGAKVILDDTYFGEDGKGAIYHVIEGVTFSTLPKGFYQLRDDKNRVLGIRYYHHTTVQLENQTQPVIYHSWTTTAAAARHQGVATELSERTLEEFREKMGGQGLVIANVEDDNTPSVKNIVKRGYKAIAAYNIGYTAALFPRKSPHLRAATAADRDAILGLLRSTYKNYNLTDFNPDTFDAADGYYVWDEDGVIPAVINAHKQYWQFRKLKVWLPQPIGDHLHNMGLILAIPVAAIVHFIWPQLPGGLWSLAGVLLTGLLATQPLRWTFNLKEHRFLKLGDVAYAPGHARTAKRLIEAAMAENGVHVAWGFFDRDGPAYHDLRKVRTFGYFRLLNLLAETKLKTYAYGFDDSSRALINTLNARLTAPKTPAHRPTYVPYRHLAWFMGPFLLLGGLLGLSTPTHAATLTPTAVHAAKQTTEAVVQYIVQPGDSWWSIAHHVLHGGARYGELMGANPAHAFMLHPGDALNMPGLLAPQMPTMPVIPMPALPPLPYWYQWVMHPTPEAVLAAILGLLAIVVIVWLWRGGARGWTRWAAQPAMAALMTLGLFAQNGGPVQAPRVEPPPPPAATLQAPHSAHARAWTANPPAAGTPVIETPIPLPIDWDAPPPALPMAPLEKTALPWLTYANARLQDAATLHAAWIQGDDIRVAVEQLRMEYLALLARRQAEQKSPVPVTNPTVKRGVVRRLAHVFTALTKPLWNKIRPPQAAEPVYDANFEILKHRMENLIRGVKRDQQLAQTLAGTDPNAPVQDANDRLEQLHAALTEVQQIPRLADEQRFEVIFAPLWETVNAGVGQLPQDIAATRREAVTTPMHVNGTEHLSDAEKRALLTIEADRAQSAAQKETLQQAVDNAQVDGTLALAGHLDYLGFTREAADTTRDALLHAHAAELLPEGKPLFRTPIDQITVLNTTTLQTQDAALWTQLAPLLQKAAEAAETFGTVSQTAADRETAWHWKVKIARGLDMALLFPEERTALLQALQDEAAARITLRSAEEAVLAALQTRPGAFSFERRALQNPRMIDPDDTTLARYEQDIQDRQQALEMRAQGETAWDGGERLSERQSASVTPSPVALPSPAPVQTSTQRMHPTVPTSKTATRPMTDSIPTHTAHARPTPSTIPSSKPQAATPQDITPQPIPAPAVTPQPAAPRSTPHPFSLSNVLVFLGSLFAFGGASVLLRITKRASRNGLLSILLLPLLAGGLALLHSTPLSAQPLRRAA